MSVRAELAPNALVAAALKSPVKKTKLTQVDSDCGCHSQVAAPTDVARYHPAASGAFTIWDVLDELSAEDFTGQNV